MTDINLLPDDLRQKDKKEFDLAKKNSKGPDFKMSEPAKEKFEQPLRSAKPSLFNRLFNKTDKIKEQQNSTNHFNETDQKKLEQNFHIPEVKDSKPIESKPAELKPLVEDVKPQEVKRQVEDKSEVSFVKPSKPKKIKGESFFARLSAKRKKKKEEKIAKKKLAKINKPEPKEKKDKDNNLDVNLIPKDFTKEPESELYKKVISNIILIVAIIVVIAIVYLGITWYQIQITQKIESLEAEIVVLDKEIATYEKNKQDALHLQDQLSLVSSLLDSHVYWTNFFELLEKYTLTDVYYTNFSMAGREKLVITAATKDYETVAKQLVAFEQASDFIKKVSITAATASVNPEDGTYIVNFNINLEFFPSAFLKPIK